MDWKLFFQLFVVVLVGLMLGKQAAVFMAKQGYSIVA